MKPRTAIGQCRTCRIPVRMDFDHDTREIVAVYAVCDCPRPSVEQANRDLARDRRRRELATVGAMRRQARQPVIEAPPPAPSAAPPPRPPTGPVTSVRCEVCHLPVDPGWAARHGPRHGNHGQTLTAAQAMGGDAA